MENGTVTKIEPTRLTPEIIIDEISGQVEFSGKSSPADAISFYEPVIKSLASFTTSHDQISVSFKMNYFNTSSVKCLLKVCKQVSSLAGKGTPVGINWYYEEDDEDMLEIGEYFEEFTNLHFEYLILSEDY